MPSQFQLLLDDLNAEAERRDRARNPARSVRANLRDLHDLAQKQAELTKALRAEDEQARLRQRVVEGTALLKSLVAERRLCAFDVARLQAGLHRMAAGLQ